MLVFSSLEGRSRKVEIALTQGHDTTTQKTSLYNLALGFLLP